MRLVVPVVLLLSAGCSYDLTRAPRADGSREGPAPDRAADQPATFDAPPDSGLDARREDGPPKLDQRPSDGAKPPDQPTPLDKGQLTDKPTDKPKDTKPKDTTKAPDKPGDTKPPDLPVCTASQCRLPNTMCIEGSSNPMACGKGGNPCVACAYQMKCVSGDCICDGCVQTSGQCVALGWTNDPNCGLNGVTCINCTQIPATPHCNTATGTCVCKNDGGKCP